jgi:hypothetical protein
MLITDDKRNFDSSLQCQKRNMVNLFAHVPLVVENIAPRKPKECGFLGFLSISIEERRNGGSSHD